MRSLKALSSMYNVQVGYPSERCSPWRTVWASIGEGWPQTKASAGAPRGGEKEWHPASGGPLEWGWLCFDSWRNQPPMIHPLSHWTDAVLLLGATRFLGEEQHYRRGDGGNTAHLGTASTIRSRAAVFARTEILIHRRVAHRVFGPIHAFTSNRTSLSAHALDGLVCP